MVPGDFDFETMAYGLGILSLLLAGAVMAGAGLFPDWAEKAKRSWIPTAIIGIVVVGVAGWLMTQLGG